MDSTDLYPSNVEDWQPVECIIDIIDVCHSSIGQQMYKGRTERSLAENGVFFYDHFYIVPTSLSSYGVVTSLPLPHFHSGEWPLPSPNTSESYRCKIFNEIQRCLKTNIASKQCRISLFMPLNVFVDFFSKVQVRKAKTMFFVRCLQDANVLEFVDEGWHMKVSNGITCKVHLDSIACKYMVAGQNFILTLYYSRWHVVNGRTIPLDQDMDDFGENPVMDIDIWLGPDIPCIVKIRAQCTIKQLRNDLENEDNDAPQNFVFAINNKKVQDYSFIFINLS